MNTLQGNAMSTILVQISDRPWTTQAMHIACALAHDTHSQLALLHLLEVRTPYLLGTALGTVPPTKDELDAIDDYRLVAASYGVEITLQRMQYESLTDALVQAAEYVHPSTMFAHIRESGIPLWRKFQLWNLRRQLKTWECQLFTLDESKRAEDSVPSVTVRAAKANKPLGKPAHV